MNIKKDLKNGKTLKKLMQKGERFAPIYGYPDYYVSNMGRVFSDKGHGKILQVDVRGAYRYVTLSVKGEDEDFKISRLVALAWCKGYAPKKVVHHCNCDSMDDRAINLMWLTEEEHIAVHKAINRFILLSVAEVSVIQTVDTDFLIESEVSAA